MRLIGLGLVLAAMVVAGCASEGDAPPWQRPGLLDGSKVAGALQNAVRETDQEMQMQGFGGGLGGGGNSKSQSRSINPPDL